MACTQCLVGPVAFIKRFSQKFSLSSEPATPTAIDIGLLSVWRYRALASLFPADEALLQHIIEYVGDVLLPPIAPLTEMCIGLGLSRNAPILECSKNLVALAVDSSGLRIVAGVPEQDQHILIWDLQVPDVEHTLEKCGRPAKVISRSQQLGQASCIWLNCSTNRLAVGTKHAAVQIFNLEDGALLANCVAQILESTRWTTVGHMHEVSVLKSAPLARFWDCSESSFWAFTPKAGNACVASADGCGVVCLWRDDAYPVMTVNAYWEAETLGLSSSKVTDLASAPGLLICSLSDAVVGFAAPEHTTIFILSTRHMCLSGARTPGPILTISLWSNRRLVAFTAMGAALLWDLPDPKSVGIDSTKIDVAAQNPCVLAAPGYIRAARPAAAVSAGNHCCWISPSQFGEAEIRWVAPMLHGPRVFHGSVRTAACPLVTASLLPRQGDRTGYLPASVH